MPTETMDPSPAMLTEAEYLAMDAKICPLVKCLNQNGIVTFASCEGHFTEGCDSLPYVYIEIYKTDPTRIVWLIEQLSRYNLKHNATYLVWILHPAWSMMYYVKQHGLALRFLRENPHHDHGLFEIMQGSIPRLCEFLAIEN